MSIRLGEGGSVDRCVSKLQAVLNQQGAEQMDIFETSTGHKQLAVVGRQMQDYSEEFGKIHGLKHMKEGGFRVLNELSQVGGMLIRVGVTFGTTIKSFSEDDLQLIAEFMKGTITNEYLSGLK